MVLHLPLALLVRGLARRQTALVVAAAARLSPRLRLVLLAEPVDLEAVAAVAAGLV